MTAALWFGPAALSLLAVLEMPYGYYTFLRLVVCVSAAFLAFSTWEKSAVWGIALVALALLFNPLVRVHLTRELWLPINIATAVLYIAHWWFVGRKPNATA